MLELEGNYNIAKVFTDNADEMFVRKRVGNTQEAGKEHKLFSRIMVLRNL